MGTIGYSQNLPNGWFIMEHPIKMNDLGGTPTSGNHHMSHCESIILISTNPSLSLQYDTIWICWCVLWMIPSFPKIKTIIHLQFVVRQILETVQLQIEEELFSYSMTSRERLIAIFFSQRGVQKPLSSLCAGWLIAVPLMGQYHPSYSVIKYE